jgi:translation initiation factor 1
MSGLFDGTPLERPVTCERCAQPRAACRCPRNAAGEITLPADQPARVRREKRGGKLVTVVSGLDPVATDLAALVKELRAALGAGGTVKGDTVEIQGDHREALVARLRELGYPAKVAGG